MIAKALRTLRKAAVLGVSLLVSGAAAPSNLPQDPPRDAATRAIDAWIDKLSSDRPEDRDLAMGELLKAGAAAVPLLKQALSKSPDPETRARLERLLSELDLRDPSAFFLGRRETPRLLKAGGESEKAVLAALRWLARHQNPDGSWSADRFPDRCAGTKCEGTGEKDYDLGVSALSILAFLGAGYTQDSREEFSDPLQKGRVLKVGECLRSGLKWLISQQDHEGCIGERGMKYVYDHAIATLALAEAWGMTRAEVLQGPSQKAVDFLVACQNPWKGWRYSAKCGDNDSSVSSWAVMALEVARFASLKIPKEASQGALAWFDEATEQNGYYQTGYNARSTGKVYIPGKNETFDHHATMTAAGITSRIFIQRQKQAPELGAKILMGADLPVWKANQIDFYYWYYGSLALAQADGLEGILWERWNGSILRALVPNQKTVGDGCQDGSWDPSVDRWGCVAGRVYATALNALTLETRYRYPAVAGRKWAPR